jgi:hypothetical protein
MSSIVILILVLVLLVFGSDVDVMGGLVVTVEGLLALSPCGSARPGSVLSPMEGRTIIVGGGGGGGGIVHRRRHHCHAMRTMAPSSSSSSMVMMCDDRRSPHHRQTTIMLRMMAGGGGGGGDSNSREDEIRKKVRRRKGKEDKARLGSGERLIRPGPRSWGGVGDAFMCARCAISAYSTLVVLAALRTGLGHFGSKAGYIG